MRRVNSTVGMSGEIEQVVTKLLRTTKALLEALTQWSHMRASNSEIFEIHDTLEKQFFLVSQAFEEANVSMSDLQWIPRQLRDSVSVVMVESPSPLILDQYLPRIREVIVHLLHGLKGKQALLREREREREATAAAAAASRGSQSWNREVPLAALNRNSSNSSTSSRIMMYPQQPQSPPLMPLSPRGNDYDPWSGGMPRPSVPVNDLSSRMIRNNGPRSPPSQSPNLSHQQIPLPSRSTSSTRQQQRMPTPPTPPPPPPPAPIPVAIAKPNLQQSFDESDPNTASALAALKRQENLARRSSVRRASMFRGNNSDYTGGSISRGAKQQQQTSETVPPVPTLPLKNVDYNVSLNTVSEAKEVDEEDKEQSQDLILFLQIGKQVQKVKYNGEISIPALNMLFLEKFSASIRQNDFPKIYIRDPTVGVSYELEDLSEVKNKSVLSLNIQDEEKSQKDWLSEVTSTFNKELSETCRVFTEQLDDMKKQITDNQKEVEQQIVTILSEHRLPPSETAVAVVAEKEETAPVETEQVQEEEKASEPETVKQVISKEQFEAQRSEIETLRRDLAVLRQLDREMREGTSTILTEIKAKAKAITDAAANTPAPTTTSVARATLEEGKTALLEKSDKVTSRLEDLQDTIDQLKLDVTQRKCRPSETIMTHCANERKALAEEIEAFGQFITQVKPRWKKTWEQELQTIVKEQQTLKDQEYLLSDMKDDLDALLEVFEQLQKIYAYQANARPQLREFRVVPAEEGFEGMNSVLKQVSTIDVDHSRRLKALEQADKMRQRELANRIDDFEKELVGFVETKKLKKTGGALEIDRLRKQKDEEMMKAMFAEKKKAASGISTPTTEEEAAKEEAAKEEAAKEETAKEEEPEAVSTEEAKAEETPEVKEE